MWTGAAFVDPYLVSRQLPQKRVDTNAWPGKHVITRSTAGIPHRQDRLGYIWAATRAANDEECTFDLREINAAFGTSWQLGDTIACLERIARSPIELSLHESNAVTPDVSFVMAFDEIKLSRRRKKGRIRFGKLFDRDKLIPVRADVICRLTRSWPTLDQYLWQVTTAWLRRDELPLEIPIDQVLVDLACEIQDAPVARCRVKTRQKAIAELWPDCPHEVRGGLFVLNDGGFNGSECSPI